MNFLLVVIMLFLIFSSTHRELFPLDEDSLTNLRYFIGGICLPIIIIISAIQTYYEYNKIGKMNSFQKKFILYFFIPFGIIGLILGLIIKL